MDTAVLWDFATSASPTKTTPAPHKSPCSPLACSQQKTCGTAKNTCFWIIHVIHYLESSCILMVLCKYFSSDFSYKGISVKGITGAAVRAALLHAQADINAAAACWESGLWWKSLLNFQPFLLTNCGFKEACCSCFPWSISKDLVYLFSAAWALHPPMASGTHRLTAPFPKDRWFKHNSNRPLLTMMLWKECQLIYKDFFCVYHQKKKKSEIVWHCQALGDDQWYCFGSSADVQYCFSRLTED